MHPSLAHLDHRPFPLPDRAWQWRQSWIDLAFLHYRTDAATLTAHLPPGLELDRFDGCAWLGIVPFRMTDVSWRAAPALPGLSRFPELNLRTYVIANGIPGVYFFSLDADSRAMVTAGRSLYNLPYHYAAIRHRPTHDGWQFTSRRRASEVAFAATFSPQGESFHAAAGSFANWATERYCLYTVTSKNALKRIHVHHRPWPLQQVNLQVTANDLCTAARLEIDAMSPICHYSTGVDVIAFPGETVSQ